MRGLGGLSVFGIPFGSGCWPRGGPERSTLDGCGGPCSRMAAPTAPLLGLQDTVTTAALAVGMTDEVRDSMLAVMGATLTAPIRTFAAVTPEQVELLLTNTTVEIPGSDPPARGPVGIFGQSAVRSFFWRSVAYSCPRPLPQSVRWQRVLQSRWWPGRRLGLGRRRNTASTFYRVQKRSRLSCQQRPMAI